MRAAVLLGAALAIGCGPGIEDSRGSGGGSSSRGEASSSGADEGSGAIDPPSLPWLELEEVRHSYTCIDGCEGFYSTDALRLELRADRAAYVVVRWQDWTIGDRALVSDDDPLEQAEVQLEPGVPVALDLYDERTGSCSFEEWQAPVRVLLEIDEVEIEVEGESFAGYGWDC